MLSEEPKSCNFKIPRKDRYCALKPVPNQLYYGMHLLKSDDTILRVPCPHNPSHSVKVADLKKHLYKCCDKSKVQPLYFNQDLNRGELDLATTLENLKVNGQPTDPKLALKEMTVSQFMEIKSKIDLIYTRVAPKEGFPTNIKTHTALQSKMDAHSGGVFKHAIQQSSLLGHMQDLGWLDEPKDGLKRCFMEFGCGSAEYTKFLSLALPAPPSKILFIDKRQHKLKVDLDFRNAHNYERLIIDIKDLDLTGCSGIEGSNSIAYSKHLCGVATDLTLRCLKNYREKGGIIEGICVALCCHQVCNRRDYVNPSYLKLHGLNHDADFNMLKHLSTWSICGERRVEGIHWSELLEEEREELGRRCKRIIDIGRLLYIQKEFGLAVEAGLEFYVEGSTSKENLLLKVKFN